MKENLVNVTASESNTNKNSKTKKTSAFADKAKLAMNQQWQTHDIQFSDNHLDSLYHDWLLTNGSGAFSMGSALGINTRRYHGLLIAASRPPVGRIVALNQVFEQLVVTTGNSLQTLEFTSCVFPGDGEDIIVPRGYTHLQRFEKGMSVAWTYQAGSVTLTKELFLHWKEQAATLRYTLKGLDKGSFKNADSIAMRLSPLVSLRDFHSLLHKDTAPAFQVESRVDGVTVKTGDQAVTLSCSQATRFERNRDWWYNLVYRSETERGQDDREDLFVPGSFEVELDPQAKTHVFTMTTALGRKPADPIQGLSEARADHLMPIFSHLTDTGNAPAAQKQKTVDLFEELDMGAVKRSLAMAADDFVVQRTIKGETLSTILAGYPWFADWGRDTFIALPGLLLETGRFEEAKATLHAFASSIRNGLVPNRFDDYDDDAAHYNTVDASLWFIQAALRYVEVTGDQDSWNDWLSGACKSIIEAYIKGTDYDIRMAGDCLIEAGNPDTQLTWMDAACGGTVFTPRHGKAVEINALWYSSLVGLAKVFADDDKQTANHYEKLAARIKRSFVKTFWNEDDNCLIDHVWSETIGADVLIDTAAVTVENTNDNENPGEQIRVHRDHSIRPNQIFVASLPNSPLPLTKQKQVLKAVGEYLLTPSGLRTLPPEDPAYHGSYTSDQYHRDGAYHQGTVWAWLIGPYVEAVLRCGKFSDDAKSQAAELIRPLLDQLVGTGFGQLHEIYEADLPHRPVGCPAQAWSIAEVLRVLRLIESH
jgi:predicted glycogen debranching enzyme